MNAHVLLPKRQTTAAALLFVSSALAVAACSASGESQSPQPAAGARPAERTSDASSQLSGWPAGPQLAGQEMMAKYGQPQEVTEHRIIWRDAGPYKRIMLTREELPHDFPLTHMDYLEHTISYKVPADKADEVHAFDASITIHPGSGELSARCDLESNNVLTLNLANDIVTANKSVAQARKEFGEAVTNRTVGKPPASTIALQFTPVQPAEAAEREKVTIEGSPERAGQAGAAKSSDGDAEAMAILIAIDENEVHAAMAAQDKKTADAVLNYAKMLHLAHGQSIAATQALGLKLGITPLESAEVDRLHAKGAQDLANLVPLGGEEFGRGFAAAMVSGHKDALATIDKLIGDAQNAAVKQHLTTARQHVTEHLKQAEALNGQS